MSASTHQLPCISAWKTVGNKYIGLQRGCLAGCVSFTPGLESWQVALLTSFKGFFFEDPSQQDVHGNQRCVNPLGIDESCRVPVTVNGCNHTVYSVLFYDPPYRYHQSAEGYLAGCQSFTPRFNSWWAPIDGFLLLLHAPRHMNIHGQSLVKPKTDSWSERCFSPKILCMQPSCDLRHALASAKHAQRMRLGSTIA
jgi:hypothetical protein